MNKKEQRNISSQEKKNINTNVYKVITDNAEFTMNIRKLNNSGELLEKLYLLRNNESLTDIEKNEEVKKIMIDYMR